MGPKYVFALDDRAQNTENRRINEGSKTISRAGRRHKMVDRTQNLAYQMRAAVHEWLRLLGCRHICYEALNKHINTVNRDEMLKRRWIRVHDGVK